MIRSTTAALAAMLISTGLVQAQVLVPGCPTPGSIPCVATQVFTPTAETTLAVTAVSGRVAYPATGSFNLMVTNTGTKTAFVKAGSVSTVATVTDIPIDAGLTIVLPQGSNTYLAAITGGSDTTSLTLRSGTGQPVIVYGSLTGSVTVVGTQDENLIQVGGVTLLRGAGATGTGSQRVTTAQDATTVAGSAPGTAGTPSTNVVSIQGVASGTSVQTKSGSITWIAGTSGTLTTTATVVAAGPTTSIITNTTAAGGGTLSLSLAGGSATNGTGIPLAPGQPVSVYGQPTGTAITGVCSTGTCSFAVQSGS